jgi:hypothetical protein
MAKTHLFFIKGTVRDPCAFSIRRDLSIESASIDLQNLSIG